MTSHASIPENTKRKGLLGYDPSLDDDLFHFQRVAYPDRAEDLIAPRWKWMFLQSAKRLGVEPMVWLYRNADGIVAHQGAIPVRLKVGTEEFTTGWFVETMVIETARGKAIGPMVIKKALDDLPFNLSLGQTQQMREIQFALGWKQVVPLNTYVLVRSPYQVVKGKAGGPLRDAVAGTALGGVQVAKRLKGRIRGTQVVSAQQIASFNDEHDALWKQAASDITCAVARDASYLNWKYVDQPGQEFTRLEIRESGRLVGIAVVMVRPPCSAYQYKRGFIVDVVAPFSHPDALRAVLKQACDHLASDHVDTITMDVVGEPMENALVALGFLRRESTRFFLVATGSVSSETETAVLSPQNWFLTMGDSDIDRPW